jgi:hypothetical protein
MEQSGDDFERSEADRTNDAFAVLDKNVALWPKIEKYGCMF